MTDKVLILKNDRTGDLFVSLNAINKIINKHYSHDIDIFLSNVNYKFSFLFPKLNVRVFSMTLSIIEKIRIFIYLISENIKTVYILTPKNFYYYLPFFLEILNFMG